MDRWCDGRDHTSQHIHSCPSIPVTAHKFEHRKVRPITGLGWTVGVTTFWYETLVHNNYPSVSFGMGVYKNHTTQFNKELWTESNSHLCSSKSTHSTVSQASWTTKTSSHWQPPASRSSNWPTLASSSLNQRSPKNPWQAMSNNPRLQTKNLQSSTRLSGYLHLMSRLLPRLYSWTPNRTGSTPQRSQRS